MSLISVIVTTYNWPAALSACLDSLMKQQDKKFEILVADDGSGPETLEAVHNYQHRNIPVSHIYQTDDGFQAAKIRNKAVAKSRGEYLLFIDGDCLLFPGFISQHRKLAESGFFVPGNRVLLNQTFTKQILSQQMALTQQPIKYFISCYLQRKINRLLPLIRFPIGPFRKLQAKKWQKAMTCNLGIHKQDFLAVNGFDELFAGWGFEDSDLVIRLIHAGIHRKEGRFAVPVLHCWHPENDKSREQENYQRLVQRLDNKQLVQAELGVTQYLGS